MPGYLYTSIQRIVPTLALGLLLVGCGRGAPPPPEPVDIEQAPATIESTFADASPECKEAADRAIAALNAGNDAQAYLELQTLAARTDLTREQQDLVAGAMIAVNQRMQASAESGDAEAARTLELHRTMK